MTAVVLETPRLILRQLVHDDAPFILELVNDPGWLRFIGDKNVRTLDDARGYIDKGPATMVAKHGFGLYLTALRDGGAPIGLCGLLKREQLADVDIGFAFLPAFRGRGYAFEAASATLAHGREHFGLQRIVAIVTPDNVASTKLLRQLGLRRERALKLTDDGDWVDLYAPENGAADAGG